MPKFDVIPDQVPSRQGSTGVRIDPNIAAPLFAADREINQAASGIVDFAIKMKEAKDFDEETSTSIKINEGFKGLLDDFGNRNDPENFDKEFDARAAELQKTEIEQGGLSFASKRRVTNNFKQQLSLNRLAANSIRDQKRIEGFRARFFVNNDKLVQDGKIEEATALLNGANQQGFIKPEEFERLKIENPENVNFYNARDFIDANPDNLEAALKEFPVNKKNADILRARADRLIKERNDAAEVEFDGFIIDGINNPSVDPQVLLDKIVEEENKPDGFLDSKEAAIWKNSVKETAERRLKDKETAEDETRERTFKSVMFDMILDIESGNLKDATKARNRLLQTLNQFGEFLDDETISKARTLINELQAIEKGEVDKEESPQSKHTTMQKKEVKNYFDNRPTVFTTPVSAAEKKAFDEAVKLKPEDEGRLFREFEEKHGANIKRANDMRDAATAFMEGEGKDLPILEFRKQFKQVMAPFIRQEVFNGGFFGTMGKVFNEIFVPSRRASTLKFLEALEKNK